jgi:ATP-binding cassette subfamily B protein
VKVKIPIKEYVSLFAIYLRPQKKSMIALFLVVISGIAIQLINPQIIRFFINSAQTSRDQTLLLYSAILFIVVSLVQQGLSIYSTYLGENIGWLATNRLRNDIALHCLKLDMAFHKTHTSGAIIERVDGDINNLANFFSRFVVSLAGNALLVTGILLLMLRENWLYGVMMTLFVIFTLISMQKIRAITTPLWQRVREVSAKYYGYLSEHLEGTEDTRANGASFFVMNGLYRLIREWLPIRTKAAVGTALMWSTTITIFAIGNALAFMLSIYLWHRGLITIGTIYMIFYYTELLVKPLENVRNELQDLQRADASILRTRELKEMTSQVQDGIGLKLPSGPLDVRFNDVQFGYEDHLTTLDHVDFRLEKGKVLGVIGRTGSGKTTLARLLLRFYDPRAGSIELSGVNVRDTTLAELRSHIGFVTQNIELFQGSVRDNLTFFNPAIADEQIYRLLQELGLDAWLESLPQGLDSLVESGGGGLSAGEAQLVSFARVFLSEPGLVILDEASSRLDPATEQKLEHAINRLFVNRTCIIIAHRLQTIQRSDNILILEQGKMVEFGERKALAADANSRFSRMLAVGMKEVLA